ncbi:MAG: T9SS type A sorting domain-containing protein [Candidatus Kapaibacterium sp.]
MKKVYSFSRGCLSLFIVILGIMAFASETKSQSWVAEAQQSGFKLKKVVSDTAVATGQTFSYTVYFTIPAGANSVNISDNLPGSVEYIGHSVTSACGTPTVSAPAAGSMGGLFSLDWSSVAGGCTGSFTITVKFPNGVTCPGTSARNNVCMSGEIPGGFAEFCTPYVTTAALADNPWNVNKYPLDAAWQGGSCSWASGSDTLTYKICVYKDVGTTGQMNMFSGVVTDTLPAGAVLVNSDCGATQSGNVVTWNVGSMSATSSYNMQCCTLDVYYPSGTFPSGSQITNSATLSGSLGSPNNSCGNFTTHSSEICVELVDLTGTSLNKWVYTNRQPGCDGRYLIYICNTGTTTLTVTANDTLPSQLTGYSLGSTNMSPTLSGNILTVNETLAPGQCGYVYVEFTIPATAAVGSVIENCVYIDIPGQPVQESCRSFTVAAPAPKPCLWKEICDQQSDYEPGDTFRYRLRIQNIGGLPITGATLTDALDPNLEYSGNPSYYTANSWNIPCTTTPANPWSGVSLNYNSSSNEVTASIDSIPASCQNLFYTNCGMYGSSGVPYYYIEFDVTVRDTSALGNIPNEFSMSGGSLTSTHNSNTVNVLVTGVVGYNLEKSVKPENASGYDSTATVAAGSTINYKLDLNSSGTAALRHVTFADLLPMNDGSNDSQILQGCASRGSRYDISYSSTLTSSPAISSTWNNSATSLADVNNLTPAGAPGAAFTLGCGTAGSWSSSWSAGQQNLAAYFGSAAIGTGASLEFAATVDASADPDSLSCNTFAASGWTKHLIQSSLPDYQLAGELESPKVCVKIDSLKEPRPCLEEIRIDVKCGEIGPNGLQQYLINLNAVSCAPGTFMASSPDGSFSPSTYNQTSSAWSFNTTFTNVSGNNPITINYAVICENEVCRDSIVVDLPPCDGQEPNDCCAKFMQEIGRAQINASNSGNVSLSVPMAAGPAPIKKFRATIVSAQRKSQCLWWGGSWERIFGDIVAGNLTVAPAPGPQLLTIFSREATWGPGECIDWNKGASLDLDMVFPAFSGNFLCSDSLKFKIRYSFTDCECTTCDTVMTYNVARRWRWTPWGNLSPVRGNIAGKDKGTKGSQAHGEYPAHTSLKMDDMANGSLYVISPDEEDNNITVTGIELRSADAAFTEVSYLGEQGLVQDDMAYIQTDIMPGDMSDISLKFDNSALKQFKVEVRFEYTETGFEGKFFTQPIEYMARVPGAIDDRLTIDDYAKEEHVQTYALHFSNSNGYEESIAAIGLKPADGARILAVGPPSAEGDKTYIEPRKVDENSYIIAVPHANSGGVEPGTAMAPIYITIAGAVDDNAMLEFTTYDDNDRKVSEGEVMLSNPLSVINKLGNSQKGSALIQSVAPNPANSSVTVSFSVDLNIENAKMSIVDMQGREIVKILDGDNLSFGSHIRVVDISKLPAGMYAVVLNTPEGAVTKQLTIVR